MPTLLAVDVGLRTGLALYGSDGRLRWYRSQHFGNRSKLRRGIYGLLRGEADLAHVVLEGGGDLVQIWMLEAGKRGVKARQIDAGEWRPLLLLPRQQQSGPKAKEAADALARRVIGWSGAARPTSLRHDAAEAILIGLWGVLQVGWLEEVPRELG